MYVNIVEVSKFLKMTHNYSGIPDWEKNWLRSDSKEIINKIMQ